MVHVRNLCQGAQATRNAYLCKSAASQRNVSTSKAAASQRTRCLVPLCPSAPRIDPSKLTILRSNVVSPPRLCLTRLAAGGRSTGQWVYLASCVKPRGGRLWQTVDCSKQHCWQQEEGQTLVKSPACSCLRVRDCQHPISH